MLVVSFLAYTEQQRYYINATVIVFCEQEATHEQITLPCQSQRKREKEKRAAKKMKEKRKKKREYGPSKRGGFFL